MVDFGGWDMPVNYGSQIDEHRAVRTDAGMFDVSHMLALDVEGAGARDFLRYVLANNVDRLKTPGKALYSCLLKPDGTVQDDLIVYFLHDDFFRLIVNAGTAEKDIEWFRERLRERQSAVTLTPRTDLAIIAVQGPNAARALPKALPSAAKLVSTLKPFHAAILEDALGEVMIARTGYTGEDGFEVVLPAAAAADLWTRLSGAGVAPCGLGARDTLRLEAGMNLYGQDMDETVTPLESGLAWTIDLASPRDFIGKSALNARPPARQLIGLVLLDKGGVLRAHQKVHTDRGDGEITSGTFSPTLNQSIALARLPAGIAAGDKVKVVVRDRELAARVVKLPFVRNGKVLADVAP
jgi:aminomethyltransferase